MLKGIEAQSMVMRTADLAREAGALQRKNDLSRDYFALQAQALAGQEKKQVTQALRPQALAFHHDKRGGGQQGRHEQVKEEKEYGEAEGDECIGAPQGQPSTIDIKI